MLFFATVLKKSSLLLFLWLQNHACLAQSFHSNPHPHHSRGNPHIIENCPPDNVASSAEEVAHFCHVTGKAHFQVHNSTYQCWETVHHKTACQGVIDPNKPLNPCSLATIDNCGDGTIYHNFNKYSRGPCLYRPSDIMWHSAKCGDGVFSCWDPSLDEWCGGTVLSDDVPEPTPICPPSTVFSIHEATHYCAKSGLSTTRSDSNDDSSYSCYWKNGTTACKGTIDPIHHEAPTCSAPIDSCEDLKKVCNRAFSRVFACHEESSEFECWDREEDQWCVGQVGSTTTTRTKKPYPISKTSSSHGIDRHQSVGTASIALILGMIAMVGVVVERNYREKFDPPQNLPVDRFGYQAVTDDMMGQDLELTSIP
jgi:hypothetical protein